MRYFIDTEFNGFSGDLISLAIVPEWGDPLYLAIPQSDIDAMDIVPWVQAHVLPVLNINGARPRRLPISHWGFELQKLVRDDDDICFVADWPDDIRHLMQAMMISPGVMIRLPAFRCDVRRLNASMSGLQDAVPHNALWDALCLRQVYVQEIMSCGLKAANG